MKPGERTAYIGPKGLKPCPLCGGPASVFEYTAGVIWTTPTVEATRIGCDRCGLEIRGDGAAKAWNTRAERTCWKLPSSGGKECTVSHVGTGLSMNFGYWKCSECGCECFEGARYCMGCGAKVVEG